MQIALPDTGAPKAIEFSVLSMQRIKKASRVINNNEAHWLMMQQCEVQFDRIATLLAGQLECIATVDKLKSKFGRGYTIRLRQDSVDDSDYQEKLSNDMKGRGCQLHHSYQGVLEYRITTTYTTWSETFSKMAATQKKYRLREFYVSDTTL
ncbi:hypothetical protein HPB51_004402 [Rhipicephalus microplus]|uniref:ABCA1-4-like C-terminal R2 regulatory domain-containing protein n=1 Tax=Rhipicephalus microplus TaxID=6941 RepID=A0A9J6EL08_RHIMP|nr:hypothetical protein HPB51_004402 [Rhipicephalus microplus]